MVNIQPTIVEITTDKAKITVTRKDGLNVEPIPQPVYNPYLDNGKSKILNRTFNPVAGFEALPIVFNLKPGEGIDIYTGNVENRFSDRGIAP